MIKFSVIKNKLIFVGSLICILFLVSNVSPVSALFLGHFKDSVYDHIDTSGNPIDGNGYTDITRVTAFISRDESEMRVRFMLAEKVPMAPETLELWYAIAIDSDMNPSTGLTNPAIYNGLGVDYEIHVFVALPWINWRLEITHYYDGGSETHPCKGTYAIHGKQVWFTFSLTDETWGDHTYIGLPPFYVVSLTSEYFLELDGTYYVRVWDHAPNTGYITITQP